MQRLFRTSACTLKYLKPNFFLQRGFGSIRKYTKEHEWVKYDETSKIGEIGITDHAQDALGDIVHLDTHPVGSAVHLGQTIGSIESVKSTSDIFSPVTGSIHEVNNTLVSDCAQINKDAENSWIYKIKIESAVELNLLMTKEEYLKFIKH